MTRKQELTIRLNELKSEVGEAPVSEAWYKRAKTWTIEALIKIYEEEKSKAQAI